MPEKILRIFLAILYFMFSLLMFATAIASAIQRMPVVAVVCVIVAIISVFFAVKRLKGDVPQKPQGS